MNFSKYEVGPCTRMVRLSDLAELWGLAPATIDRLLAILNVPVLRVEDEAQDAVLMMALESALVGLLMPGGPGIWLRDPGEDRPAPAPYDICPPTVIHWDRLRDDPVTLQLVCALGALLYGSQDEKELKKLVWALGDIIVNESTHRYTARRTRKPEKNAGPRRSKKHSIGRKPAKKAPAPENSLDFSVETS